MGKIIMLFAVYWWVFLIAELITLLCRLTLFHRPIFKWLSNYDGQFWWVFLILTIIAIIIRLLLGTMNVQ